MRAQVMHELINYIIFGWYPYFCLTVFLLGSVPHRLTHHCDHPVLVVPAP